MKRGMKRKLIIFSLLCFFIIFISTLVSAQNSISDFFSEAGQVLSDTLLPFFSTLLGVTSGEAALSKILLFLLLWLIVDAVIGKISIFKRYWFHITISFIVSILSIRFLATEEIVTAILLPYGAMGIAITSIVPVLVFAYFIQSIDNSVVRRIGYVAFVVLFLGLWWARRADIGDLGYFYVVAAGLLLVTFIFDGTVNKWLRRAKAGLALEKTQSEEISILTGKISNLQSSLASARTSAQRGKIIDQIKEAKQALKDLTLA